MFYGDEWHSELSTKIYDKLQMPSRWDNDANYNANWNPNHSIDKNGDFEVDWKARLDFDGNIPATTAFTLLNDDTKKLFPIIKLKEGSNSNVVPQR